MRIPLQFAHDHDPGRPCSGDQYRDGFDLLLVPPADECIDHADGEPDARDIECRQQGAEYGNRTRKSVMRVSKREHDEVEQEHLAECRQGNGPHDSEKFMERSHTPTAPGTGLSDRRAPI